MTVVYLKGGVKVPVPEGWTLEEVIRVLREVGHEVVEVKAAA